MRSMQSQIVWCGRLRWSLAIVAVAMAAGFYVLGYRPVTWRLSASTLQMESKQRELDQNQNRAKYLPILAMEVSQLEGQVQQYDRQFPKQPELGEFIRQITQIGRRYSVKEWKYQPQAPKRMEHFFEMPIQMHFEGEYGSAAAFLREVEQLPRTTRVKKLLMKGKDVKNGVVEVDATVNIYFSER